MRLTGDYHTHTTASDAKSTIEENVLAAIERGLLEIAITDHSYKQINGCKDFSAMRRKTDDLNARYAGKIKILLGAELNLLGRHRADMPDDAGILDYCILGYHRSVPPSNGFTLRALCEVYFGRENKKKNAEELLETARRYKNIAFFSHPCEYINMDMELLAKGAKELNILLELNQRHQSIKEEDIIIARDTGAKFIINSDAHTASQIGRADGLVALADRLGITQSVVNLDKLWTR